MKAELFVGLTVLLALAFSATAKFAAPQQGPSWEVQQRIQKEVRHQLVMLPYPDAFPEGFP